jgi:hypothetical protein
MRRRELILLLGGMMTAARALRAEQKVMPVIGCLSSASPGPNAPYLAAFGQGLSQTGWVEGQNAAIEYRWAEGQYDRLPGLAADLVRRKVHVIAALGLPSAMRRCHGSLPSLVFLLYQKGKDSRIFQPQDRAIDDFFLLLALGQRVRLFCLYSDRLLSRLIEPEARRANRTSIGGCAQQV